MRVDLDTDGLDLTALPRFQRARFHARALLIQAAGLGAPALALLAAVRWWPALADTLLRPLLAAIAAALLVLVVGLLSAAAVARWRSRAGLVALPAPIRVVDGLPRWRRGLWRLRDTGAAAARGLRSDGVHALLLAVLAAVAVAAVALSWNLTLPGLDLGKLAAVAGGSALLLAFCLLVLERWFAHAGDTEWPEAAALAQLSRVTLLTLLLAALCLLMTRADKLWPARLAVLCGVLPAAVALELALRALLSLFVRRPPTQEPRLLASSFIANLLQWPPRPLQNLQDELHSRFGIDLRQNWAFGYMRRALLPVIGVVLAAGWLLSGVREIPIDGRGVYERFGKPVVVLGSGLHPGLPWPFSRLRAVENGVVHALSTTLAAETDVPDSSSAEGPPPDSANRLWDASHVSEKSQVIASLAGDRQSFQVVYMDVRFIYRIGLGDEAALAATYNSADVPTLIRSTAGRVLVEDFASRTLDGVLGEKREALATAIGTRVQTELDALNSGVELLATLIEQIHPPSGAANAYHSVQASVIKAQAAIARERGRRAEDIQAAELLAAMTTDKASANARETMAGAEAAQLRFNAEQTAYKAAGPAFVLEQYLAQLSLGLKDAKLVVLDHRIGSGASAPTLDLRTYAPKGDTATP